MMNMQKLFDDFKKYVDAMDDYAVLKSINDAVSDTANSYIFDGISENGREVYAKSSTQEVTPIIDSKSNYAFSSIEVDCSQNQYSLSEIGGIAA